MLAVWNPAVCSEGNRLDGFLADEVIESLCTSHYPLWPRPGCWFRPVAKAGLESSHCFSSQCFGTQCFAFTEAQTATVWKVDEA
jgi:hypothetical protein